MSLDFIIDTLGALILLSFLLAALSGAAVFSGLRAHHHAFDQQRMMPAIGWALCAGVFTGLALCFVVELL